jgi:hypothetical protein
MSNPQRELAVIVAKAKDFVQEAKKKHPQARILLAKALEPKAATGMPKGPAFRQAEASAPRQASVIFVAEPVLALESPAGKLLAKIVQAMGLQADDVLVCSPGELEERAGTLKPRALVALGQAATLALLKSGEEFGKLRGRFARHGGLPLMPTHHPAELLNNEALKRHVWEDMKLVAAQLALPQGGKT